MTDYDDIRFCCTGADICLKCWPLMTIVIKVVDAALRGWFFLPDLEELGYLNFCLEFCFKYILACSMCYRGFWI